MKVKEPSKTNLVPSRHIKKEKASLPVISLTAVFWIALRDIQKTAAMETTLPVDVGRSETSLLKLSILWRIPEKLLLISSSSLNLKVSTW